MSADEYRQRAVEFFQMAEAAADARQRAWLIEMARVWLSLAAQAEKNSTADLWYETPSRDEVRASQQQQQPQPKTDVE